MGSEMDYLVSELRSTAEEISRYMGYFPATPGQSRTLEFAGQTAHPIAEIRPVQQGGEPS